MDKFKKILKALTAKEKVVLTFSLAVLAASLLTKGVVVVRDNSKLVPVEGGNYVEGMVGQPSSINPVISSNSVDQEIGFLIYPRLFNLASDIKTSNNGKVYTVRLKQDLIWDDGRPLTSDDVIFTLNMIQNPEVNSPLAKNWQGVVAERVSELEIKFTLPSPFVFFKTNLKRLPIIPQHIFGVIPPANLNLSDYNLRPVGGGYYKFSGFDKKKNGFITGYNLVVNETYSGKKPLINKLNFRFYKTREDLIEAFKKKEIDGFGTLSPFSASELNLSGAISEKLAMPRYYAIFFNPKAISVLDNQEFRRALTVAINKEELVKTALRGEGHVIKDPSLNFNGEDIYNPEEAKKIISSFKEDNNGEKIEIRIIVPEVAFIERTAEFVKEKWEEMGVDDVRIVSLNPKDFFNVVIRERNYEAVIFGNILENDLDLFPFWHSSERFYPGFNLSFYANEKVDSALEEIRQTKNVGKRKELFQRAVSVIKESFPVNFLYTIPYTYIHSSKLKGFSVEEGKVVVPKDRFSNVAEWYVKEARVFEDKTLPPDSKESEEIKIEPEINLQEMGISTSTLDGQNEK